MREVPIWAMITIALFILAIAFGPWLILWAIGVLFGIYIPLTFKTWLAVLVLAGALRA